MIELTYASAPALLETAGGVTPGGSQMQSQDTFLVPLRARDGHVRAHALIDASDAAFVTQWRWHLNSGGYAARSQYLGGGHHGRVKTFKLHRELLGLVLGDDLEGDHISRDKLDNRRSNLRVITKDQQAQNKSGHGVSAHRGVVWNKASRKWMARIHVGRRTTEKSVFLGLFTSEHEAAEAARAARARLMPYAVD